MTFNKLISNPDNFKNKYIYIKKEFIEVGHIKEEYVRKSFDFAYAMTFGNKGQHRNYRSGGKRRRKNGEIFANTFQGKLCEFALYQLLRNDFNINMPDLSLYDLGKWDEYDFKINDYTVSVKSTKSFGQLLLLETRDWNNYAQYVPNNNEDYDVIFMIRLKDDNEYIMKRNRLYYSQFCKKEYLWNLFEDNEWAFDIPKFITKEELKYLIKNKFIIRRGDFLNGRTKMDADNYYCHLADMHDFSELK